MEANFILLSKKFQVKSPDLREEFEKVLDKAPFVIIIKGEMAVITVSMQTELIAAIDEFAKKRNMPLSHVVAEAVEKYLKQELKTETPRSSEEKKDQKGRAYE